eukprot:403375314
MTNFYKAKIALQDLSQKLETLKEKIENSQTEEFMKLIQCYQIFIAVSYQKSGYYNTAYPLLQQIVDENKELIKTLTQENLLKCLDDKSDEKLFKYHLKVQLSLSKLHGYYFEYKTADNILTQLETNLVKSLEDVEDNHKSKVIIIQTQILNSRAKYYMNLHLYDKTKDVLFEILRHADILIIDKRMKYLFWLENLDLLLKSEQIDEIVQKHKNDLNKINLANYNLRFVAQKEGIKYSLILNKHHIFNLQQLHPKSKADLQTILASNSKKEIEILDPNGTELYISMILDCSVQLVKHSKFDADSDQQLETYKFFRDMCKQFHNQLGDNNKFMDMIFYWNQLLIQSIQLSPLLVSQLVDEASIYLDEIAMPFYLNQVNINKMSVYKIFSVLYYLILQLNQLQNHQATNIISKNYLELLKIVKGLDQVSDGTIDFFELCERVSPMLHNMIQTKEQKTINLREVYDYLTEIQKVIAEQMFHGHYYNYINQLLQQEKALIVTMKNSKYYKEQDFQDLPFLDQLVVKEQIQFYKNSFSYFLNSEIKELIQAQSALALQSIQHELYIFYMKELNDYNLKVKEYKTYIEKSEEFMDYLMQNSRYEECISQALQFLSLVEKIYPLKMIIQIESMHLVLALCQYHTAFSYRALNKQNEALKHIKNAVQKINEIEQIHDSHLQYVAQIRITYNNILLDCGQFQPTDLQNALIEVDKYKNYMVLKKNPQVKKEYQELKERLEKLEEAQVKKFMVKRIGIAFIVSGIAIGVAIMLAKKKNI